MINHPTTFLKKHSNQHQKDKKTPVQYSPTTRLPYQHPLNFKSTRGSLDGYTPIQLYWLPIPRRRKPANEIVS